MSQSPSFLGTGWDFPPSFGTGGAEVTMVSGAEDIHRSLAILFATRKGERPMQESYGCDLDSVMFEELDSALVLRVRSMVYDAVLDHEPRVDLRAVDVQPTDEVGVLEIRIEYGVRGINSRYNMVFPFFLVEATALGV